MWSPEFLNVRRNPSSIPGSPIFLLVFSRPIFLLVFSRCSKSYSCFEGETFWMLFNNRFRNRMSIILSARLRLACRTRDRTAPREGIVTLHAETRRSSLDRGWRAFDNNGLANHDALSVDSWEPRLRLATRLSISNQQQRPASSARQSMHSGLGILLLSGAGYLVKLSWPRDNTQTSPLDHLPYPICGCFSGPKSQLTQH